MKINFIVPGPEFNFYKRGGYRIPNIGVLYLATILNKSGHEVGIYDENITEITSWPGRKKLKNEVLDADAFGISILTPSANKGYQYADQIRERKPGAKIVMGGMHASALPEEAIKHADYVVTKEGEGVIQQVFEDNLENKIIKGELSTLDDLSFPDFSLLKDHKKATFFPILASRGCPYKCNFCQVPAILGKNNYRYRNPEQVFEELKERNKEGQKKLFFNDDLFGLRKEDTMAFLEKMIREELGLYWTAETRTNILCKNEDMVKLMGEAGCHNVHIGIESTDQKVLDSYDKRQSVSDIEMAVKIAHQNGVKINGMFILGSDQDDDNTINGTGDFLRRTKLDTATFSILYPIPETQLYAQLSKEGRILTYDWSLYDGMHVVSKPKNMSPIDLQETWKKTWRDFYSTAAKKKKIGVEYLIRKWERINKEYLENLRTWSLSFAKNEI